MSEIILTSMWGYQKHFRKTKKRGRKTHRETIKKRLKTGSSAKSFSRLVGVP